MPRLPGGTGGFRLKTALVILAVVALGVGLADTAAATCYIHQHEIDPVRQDTGTAVDKVVVHYDHAHCEPIPP